MAENEQFELPGPAPELGQALYQFIEGTLKEPSERSRSADPWPEHLVDEGPVLGMHLAVDRSELCLDMKIGCELPANIEEAIRSVNILDRLPSENAAGQGIGFIFKNGTYRTIDVPDSAFTDVYQAQDNGVVMVGDVVKSADNSLHAFRRLGLAKFQILDFPGTSDGTVARWINQRGDIVGANGTHGYILRNSRYTTIDFPGAIATLPLAVNDDGVIVGICVDQKGALHGFKAVRED
jgi:hypothetical protein